MQTNWNFRGVLKGDSGGGTEAGDSAIKNAALSQLFFFATKPWSHTMGYISILTRKKQRSQ